MQSYEKSISEWRAEQEAALRAPEGWLSLAGLFWLKAGANRLGSDPHSEVVLPAGAAARFVGELCLKDGVVNVGVANDELRLNGEPPAERPLYSDSDPQPDRLTVGRLVLQIIRRGERVGVRVRDPERPQRTSFPGRRWYPLDTEYRLQARFAAYDPPRKLAIATVIGDINQELSPGAVLFELAGQELRLEARAAGDGGLILLFRDASSGAETYGAGRTLRTPPPANGMVELDFNRAANPWCAFTPYATCPLPPLQNRLPLAVRAGELAPPELASD